MLDINMINTFYGDSQSLFGVQMKVEPLQITAVLGRNGMGKTTLINSVMGLIHPRSGSIHFIGKNITHLPPYAIASLGLALVPQGRRIFRSLSTKENLVFGAKVGKEKNTWSLERIYSLFPILKQRERQRATSLSGGEQQMLAIARALITNPRLILMDEPSEGLAPIIVRKIESIVMDMKKDGLSVLLVEQDIPFAVATADYIYAIQNGRIVHESNTNQFFKNQEAQLKYIGVVVENLE